MTTGETVNNRCFPQTTQHYLPTAAGANPFVLAILFLCEDVIKDTQICVIGQQRQ